ncbi:DNA primase large subunit [Candidatus Halobonum tyrrellensis]|uniref:DNA primase large subunit PriL n=1 Tax=Candidatus Halobonum tyrrellensis G22 TaxID=1324957 RepID=V4IWD3_9EURY|nr:DNA primase large subunit [Candidatus Halobonum tyrrellensis]ESP87497.1 DNA primase, large subunit [Candidatus Halobonum tyrrellensis G22]
MDPLSARYPFLSSARDAVRGADVDLTELVAAGDPAVDRGRERVERALVEGTTEPETPDAWDDREELLSYPIARILVSLLDSPAAVEKYAGAEARTAHARFTADAERERREGRARTAGEASASDAVGSADSANATRASPDLDTFLREFDLAGTTRAEEGYGGPVPRWFRLGVGSYLRYVDADWGDGWRLVNRELFDGEVRVEREELYRLLREAVRERVAEGLPFEGVDDAVAADLEAEISDLRDLLADRTARVDVSVVAPEQFPPCLARLLDRARAGEELDAVGRFALLSFLAELGLTAAETTELTGLPADEVAGRFGFLRDESGAQYPAPSCETLGAYGLCENEGNHRAVAPHPLSYYAKRVAETDTVTDWRDRAERTDDGRADA